MANRKPDSNSETSSAASEHYTVLARRYRPQQFNDLVGQEHVAQALTNALKSGRVAHAYLFTGSRGVGKTSTARILAKALNCEKGPTITPCDECEVCQSIMSGDDVDVLEIDGASNRRIDEIREIRQNVQYRPSRSRFKIFIIDEVHMLTTESFNALLKTLEEPPPHVKFIFATTEIQKIPITILSRCQRFDFAGISINSIAKQLQRIITQENMQANDEALELIARRAGGSMRDAESLLDQLLAFGEKTLTAEQVHQLLGTAHDDRVIDLAAAILAEDAKTALELLAAAADTGLDLSELLNQFIEYWRDLLVVHCGAGEGQGVSVGSRHRDKLTQQAQATSLDSLLAGLDVLTTTKNRMMRGSHHGRILVEMAIVRLSRLGHLMALSQLAELLQNPSTTIARPPSPSKTPFSAPPPAKKNDPVNGAVPKRTGLLEMTPANCEHIWHELLAQLPPLFGHDLRRNTRPAILGPNALVIQVPAPYNQHKQLQDGDKVDLIEKALQQITGQSCQVRFDTVTPNPQNSTKEEVQRSSSAPSSRQRTQRAKEVPLVQKIMDVLDAEIRNEDPGFAENLEETSHDA